MRNKLLIIAGLLLACLTVSAQNPDLDARFTPTSIFVNSFKTASFDPETPWTQPILTSLLINNTSSSTFHFYMKVEIFWSGVNGPLVSATYISAEALPTGTAFPVLTNQDIITNQASTYFNRVGSINFSLDAITSRSDVLKRAVMAGYFPDGILTVQISVQPENLGYAIWNSATVRQFLIDVRTAGTLQLVAPGVPIGNNPPKIGSNPLNYLWNTISTPLNDYTLEILELPLNNPPQASSLAQSGRLFYRNKMNTFFLNDFLPYSPGNYYAWRVVTPRYTELNPAEADIWREDREDIIASEWFVFQYVLEDSQDDTPHRINAYLNALGNKELRKLIDNGFLPAGYLLWQGRTLTGQDAIDLLELLKDKELQVRIWE